MDILMWAIDFLSTFAVWLVEWMSHSTLLIQIYFDTGYMAVQQYMMPVLTQDIHDRLEAWILKDEEKK